MRHRPDDHFYFGLHVSKRLGHKSREAKDSYTKVQIVNELQDNKKPRPVYDSECKIDNPFFPGTNRGRLKIDPHTDGVYHPLSTLLAWPGPCPTKLPDLDGGPVP